MKKICSDVKYLCTAFIGTIVPLNTPHPVLTVRGYTNAKKKIE